MNNNIKTIHKNDCFRIDSYNDFIYNIIFTGEFVNSNTCLQDLYSAIDYCLEKKEKFALIFDTTKIKSMPQLDLIVGLINKIKKHGDELDKYLICTCILVSLFGKVLMDCILCMYTPKLPFTIEKEIKQCLSFIYNIKNKNLI